MTSRQKFKSPQEQPSRINKITRRHSIVKLLKTEDKEKILKATRKNRDVTYKEVTVRL